MVICIIGGGLNSFLYSKYLRKKNKGWIFWFAILFCGGLITFDFLIYINIIDPRIIFPWIEIPSGVNLGSYYMWNPGLIIGLPNIAKFFKIPYNPIIPGSGIAWDIFALMLFISYIWWFTIGQNLGRFMFGRLEYEKGAWYLLRTTKMIKRSKEKLEKKQQQKET